MTKVKTFPPVMFPIQDINHKVIGFGGRVMGDGKPKYLNSPETMIFDKTFAAELIIKIFSGLLIDFQ